MPSFHRPTTGSTDTNFDENSTVGSCSYVAGRSVFCHEPRARQYVMESIIDGDRFTCVVHLDLGGFEQAGAAYY